MRLLAGVIEIDGKEKLLMIEDGVARLEPVESQAQREEFGCYQLLKKRELHLRRGSVSGPGVFRFRYGPVTAGVREAGCFNLYTFGEKILHAGIDVSWKHRGIEETMSNKTPQRALALAEAVCSNFAFSHSVAYARAVENALHSNVDMGVQNWRNILLEAERIYNHLHVITKLASAAAQKVLTSHLSSLFEEALRLNEILTGSRYLMGINQVGGFHHLPSLENMQHAISGYSLIAKRFEQLYVHSVNNANYMDRLHAAGTITADQAIAMGLSGPSLRACGVKDDLNTTISHLIQLPVITQNEGDALARMEVRAEEIMNSCEYIIDHLKISDAWNFNTDEATKSIRENGEGCGIANSPSGAVAYYVVLQDGIIAHARIFTPSYVGMHAAAFSLDEYIFTDFPFIFDSFGVHFSDAAR
jgi:Ni,Fe-hydrogenase III large subunit